MTIMKTSILSFLHVPNKTRLKSSIIFFKNMNIIYHIILQKHGMDKRTKFLSGCKIINLNKQTDRQTDKTMFRLDAKMS